MNKFKDVMGRWRTESLFVERCRVADDYPPMFTLLKDKHTPELPALEVLYMSCDDPTEYEFATTYLGGWAHWQVLAGITWMKPYVARWREEMEVKVRAKGVKSQIKAAEKGNANAAKWVAEKGWVKRKAGAPSKEEVARERKVAAGIEADIDEYHNRLFN